ncbi:MAG: FAD-dependent oxidoreductase [Myxococcales bacterium]|nr:MAG: FAD-dependent oxidoreductase [Myxococcales bacterium]
MDIQVLEASARVGGGLRTHKRDGFVVEGGADSMLAEPRDGLDLALALGLEEQIIATNEAHRGAYVFSDGKLNKSRRLSAYWSQ